MDKIESESIKVVQLQFSMKSAGSSAVRLHHAFLRSKVSSKIITLYGDARIIDGVTELGRWPKLKSRIDLRLKNLILGEANKEYGSFSYPILGTDVSRLCQVQEADVIYIHWVLNGFLNFRSLTKLAKLNKPVVFVMHDMWNITGGCHYSFDCKKFKNHCFDCQIFTREKKKDYSYYEFDKKKRFYSQFNNLYFISPSKWLYNLAKESELTHNKPIFRIPNILDNTGFKPVDKEIAKQFLGICKDNLVISFGVMTVDSPYKGWSYLEKALEILAKKSLRKNIVILIFGERFNENLMRGIPYKVKFLGYLADEHSLSLAYNASDVFVVPSIADNFPTTIQESLSCGTPVVGFNTGGIPDMIRHKENGYLAKYRDAEDLANGIDFCLDKGLKGFRLEEFKSERVLELHLELLDFLKRTN